MADINVRFAVDIELNEFIQDAIMQLDNDQIIKFVKNLDAEMQDWDFTLKLYEYFREQRENWKQIDAEMND